MINLDKSKTLNPDLTDEQAISKIMNDEIIQKLKSIGFSQEYLDKNLEIIKNHKIDFHKQPTTTTIANIMQSNTIKEKDFKKKLSKFNDKYQPLAYELLAHTLMINSPRKLNKTLKLMDKKIQKIASDKGIDNKNIYYYIPEKYKSYSYINYINHFVNNVPVKNIISEESQIPVNQDKKLVVVLDDFAGSGYQMEDMPQKLNLSDNLEMVLAPIICMDTAKSYLTRNDDEIKPEDRSLNESCPTRFEHASLIAGQIVESFPKSDYMKSLPKEIQNLFTDVICDDGIGSCASSVAMPYMTPDNNNSMFAALFGPFFIIKGKGIKNDGYEIPT